MQQQQQHAARFAAGPGCMAPPANKLPQQSPLSILDANALGHSPYDGESPYYSGSDASPSPLPLQLQRPSVCGLSPVPEFASPPRQRQSAFARHAPPSGLGSPTGSLAGKSLEGRFEAEGMQLQPPALQEPPPTPVNAGRARHRARLPARNDILRKNSLNDNKVLLATNLKRTESLICPALFQFSGHFQFLSLLGTSRHSEVYKVRHKHTNELFAVKRCRRKFQSRKDRERCMHEIQAVAALPAHPHIVGHYRAWQQDGHMYIQMDLAEGGSLAGVAEAARARGEKLPEELLWRVLRQVSQGLDFLSRHGVLHLDIKPSNLYTTHGGDWMIGDFGLAVLHEQWSWEEGDGDYVAPELLRPGAEPSSAADVYSLGASLYECATGRPLPRSGPERDTGCVLLPQRSAALQWLVQRMLAPDPRARPTAAQVVEQVDALFGALPPPAGAPAAGKAGGSAALGPPTPRDADDAPDADEITSPLRAPRCEPLPRGPLPPGGARVARALSGQLSPFMVAPGPGGGGGCGDALGGRLLSMAMQPVSRASSLASMASLAASCDDSGAAGAACGGAGALTFNDRLEAAAAALGGGSADCGEEFDGLPPVQPSTTPVLLRRGGSRRAASRAGMPPRAPSFSFIAAGGSATPSVHLGKHGRVPEQEPAEGLSSAEKVARCMSTMSLGSACGGAASPPEDGGGGGYSAPFAFPLFRAPCSCDMDASAADGDADGDGDGYMGGGAASADLDAPAPTRLFARAESLVGLRGGALVGVSLVGEPLVGPPLPLGEEPLQGARPGSPRPARSQSGANHLAAMGCGRRGGDGGGGADSGGGGGGADADAGAGGGFAFDRVGAACGEAGGGVAALEHCPSVAMSDVWGGGGGAAAG